MFRDLHVTVAPRDQVRVAQKSSVHIKILLIQLSTYAYNKCVTHILLYANGTPLGYAVSKLPICEWWPWTILPKSRLSGWKRA